MPEIIVNIVVRRTVSEITKEEYSTVREWIKTNITDKLPSDCSLNVSYNLQE